MRSLPPATRASKLPSKRSPRSASRLEDLPREALYLAGKAYRQYRERKGTRTGVLADFFIGAHAAVLGIPVLTRDVARIHTYFPTVTLISPR